ncbi:MAG: DUF4446 domain-containing protein [Chloroflexi bacterium]|nr:DUF4446 family protein [Anaerolineae bacterium]RLC70030.1 MAG: DUF4446 domain-containing protein [Chloroflexota bacterium]
MQAFVAFYQSYAPWLWLGSALLGLAAILWLIAVQVRLNRAIRQYQSLVAGTSASNLEEVLNAHIAEVRQTVAQVQELDDRTKQMEKTLRHSMQWLGMVRFNPFRDTGGDQSFAIALVDGHGNGVVISSLHARDGTRVYAKPLRRWESTYTLTDEEKEAIARAYQQQG